MVGRVRWVLAVVVAVGALAAGCAKTSSSGSAPSSAGDATKASSASTTSAASSEVAGSGLVRFEAFEKLLLQQAGCARRGPSNILGADADAAVLAFQRAKGLQPTGELDEVTSTALSASAAARETDVCDSPGASGTASPARCSAVSVRAGLPAEAKLTGFACSGDQASAGTSGPSSGYFLRWTGSGWGEPVGVPEACGRDRGAEAPAELRQVACLNSTPEVSR